MNNFNDGNGSGTDYHSRKAAERAAQRGAAQQEKEEKSGRRRSYCKVMLLFVLSTVICLGVKSCLDDEKHQEIEIAPAPIEMTTAYGSEGSSEEALGLDDLPGADKVIYLHNIPPEFSFNDQTLEKFAWEDYEIQEGDTLWSISEYAAERVGIKDISSEMISGGVQQIAGQYYFIGLIKAANPEMNARQHELQGDSGRTITTPPETDNPEDWKRYQEYLESVGEGALGWSSIMAGDTIQIPIGLVGNESDDQ